MNIKKTGAATLSAVALIVLISGCAGVRSQINDDAGQARSNAVQSLQQQQDTTRQEAGMLRERTQGVSSATLQTQEAVRAVKQAEARSSVDVSSQTQEAVRAVKQAEAQSSMGISSATSQTHEAVRAVKQAEARSSVEVSAATSQTHEAVRAAKQAEAQAALEAELRRIQLDREARFEQLH